jgi:hypothetical protein
MKLIVYTHTDVNWVLPFWFKQTDKYMKDYEKILFINNPNSIDRNDYKIIQYDDRKTYRYRVLDCLSFLDDNEVVMFNHEDMFLYDLPDYDKLNEIITLVENDLVHLVKLLRNGDILEQYNGYDYLFHNKFGFSIQPTIIKVKTLKRIFSEIYGNTIWEFEHNTMNLINNWGLVNLFIYDNKPKRGSNHWDSGIYPYVATAVVKGKWNDEYYEILSKIKNQ